LPLKCYLDECGERPDSEGADSGRLLQIPCEEILSKYTKPVGEGSLSFLEDVVIETDFGVFKFKKGDAVEAECIVGYRVYLVARPGDRVSPGDAVGFSYSRRGVVRKIKAERGGVVMGVIQDPTSTPERVCMLYTPGGGEDGR